MRGDGEQGLHLVGAHSDGPLDLRDRHIPGRVVLQGCSYTGILAAGARLGSLEIRSSCEIGAIDGVAIDLGSARLRAELTIEDSVVSGDIRARGLVVAGPVAVISSPVGQPDAVGGTALDLVDARCLGSLELRGGTTHVHGPINLTGARISGLTKISGAAHLGRRLAGLGSKAMSASLDLDRARLDGGITIEGPGTDLDGHITMIGARVEGQLRLVSGVTIGTEVGDTGTAGNSVVAAGATVDGQIYVRRGENRFAGPIWLEGARISGNVVINDVASIGRSTKSGDSLVIRGACLDQDLIFGGNRATCSFDGGIDLSDVHLAGSMLIRPGTCMAANDFGNALFADRLVVEGDVRLARPPTPDATEAVEGPHLRGGLRLGDASIGGSLVIDDGSVVKHHERSTRHVGVDAAGLSLTRDLIVRGTDTTIDGSVLLTGATIGGSVLFEHGVDLAHVTTPTSGAALDIDGATIEGDLTIDATRVDGAITMDDATVGGAVTITAGEGERRFAPRTHPPAHALVLSRARIGTLRAHGDVGLKHVDLRACQIATLDDDPSFWRLFPSLDEDGWRTAPPVSVYLDDLDVGRLPDDQQFPQAARRAWLRGATSPHTRRRAPAGQPTYRSFARALSAAGDDRSALGLLAEMKRRHRGRLARNLGRAVDQGYQPARGILWLLLLFVVVAGATLLASDGGYLLDDSGAQMCPDGVCLDAIAYSADVVTPVFDLGERDRWQFREPSGPVLWLPVFRVSMALAHLVGAGLTGLFIIGASARILDRRDHV